MPEIWPCKKIFREIAKHSLNRLRRIGEADPILKILFYPRSKIRRTGLKAMSGTKLGAFFRVWRISRNNSTLRGGILIKFFRARPQKLSALSANRCKPVVNPMPIQELIIFR
ncbi:MAG: hypothetical protein DBX55_06980 [Verrucomicrobia bacterium]|nr:MAG: hypothetical protein DBX55_06980 [Verrucomicrobiota bacterium]